MTVYEVDVDNGIITTYETTQDFCSMLNQEESIACSYFYVDKKIAEQQAKAIKEGNK
jgi:hypothetical protein